MPKKKLSSPASVNKPTLFVLACALVGVGAYVVFNSHASTVNDVSASFNYQTYVSGDQFASGTVFACKTPNAIYFKATSTKSNGNYLYWGFDNGAGSGGSFITPHGVSFASTPLGGDSVTAYVGQNGAGSQLTGTIQTSTIGDCY